MTCLHFMTTFHNFLLRYKSVKLQGWSSQFWKLTQCHCQFSVNDLYVMDVYAYDVQCKKMILNVQNLQ